MRRLASPEEAAGLLARGGVVLMPTDTVPGLHAVAGSEAAIARILDLKGRAEARPFLLLCADPAGALALCAEVDERVEYYAARCWPGPFTLILKASELAPRPALAGAPTVALRVPEPPWLRRLVSLAGGPLVSTSANAAGATPPRDLAEAERWVAGRADAVFAPAGPAATPAEARGLAVPRASALADLTVRPARLLREGPLPLPPEPPQVRTEGTVGGRLDAPDRPV